MGSIISPSLSLLLFDDERRTAATKSVGVDKKMSFVSTINSLNLVAHMKL